MSPEHANVYALLAGLMLWGVPFWERARGCGACGARRPDKHSPDCPFRYEPRE